VETQTLDIPVIWPNYFEDCEQCIERLRQMLEELDGMHIVEIDTGQRALKVTYDRELVTFEEIQEHARLAGVTLAQKYRHEVIRIAGLDCPDCAAKLESGIRRLDGVAWASLSYATSVLIVEYEPRIGIEAIKARVRSFGYEVQEPGLAGFLPAKTRRIKSARTALTAISGVLLALGLGAQYALGQPSIAQWLYIAAAVTGGVFAARSGFLSVRALSLDTNFLMTAAAIGAIWLGDCSEAAAVMFLFSLGSALEASTVDKARRSLRSLVEAFPVSATVRRNGAPRECPLHEVEIGDIVLIKPGDKIPVDGAVTEGESSVNEAPITGEPLPKSKARGDWVYAGTINGRGALEVRATTTFDDNTLSRIIHLVEEAHAQRAPSQRFTETFGRYYTPVVIGLAFVVAIAGPIVTGEAYQGWLSRALTLLVVSCPCALVISTPVAIVAAIATAARSGVLIKGGAHLERLGQVSVVAFDKTGTLTIGRPSVTDVIAFNGHTQEEVLAYASAVESRSEHPLADAIVAKAREMELTEPSLAFFEAIPGKGARAVADSRVFYIGSRRLMQEIGHTVPNSDAIEQMLSRGKTVVYLAGEDGLWGAIAASDTLRAGARDTIHALRAAGVKRTVLLTGDTGVMGSWVAEHLGIDEQHSELLPEDKLARIHSLTHDGEVVAMVGDGINDAPALAAADIGVAMGGAGSHTAIEAADVALMADDIIMLPYSISLGRRVKRVIAGNVVFAVAVVVLLVCGAVMNKVTLATGVLGHEGSALIVIANSMRLLKK